MTLSSIHIFLTGATGYIGGTILTRLLKDPRSELFKITVIVRDPEKAKQLKSLGVKAVIGSHNDVDQLKECASEADVVFAAADVDDLGAAKAILNGMRKRYERTGAVPILIHTSGTAVLCDNANGMYDTDTVYSDLNVDQIESLPPTQPHREVDITVVGADQAGYIRSHIILPATIWGIASGPLVALGVQNPHSQQIPLAIKTSLARGQGCMVGEGKNYWPNVNIEELGDLYMLVFNAALSTPKTPHGREGFYFGATDEHRLREVYNTVARALYELGRGQEPEPIPLGQDEVQKYFGLEMMATTVMGGNSRCRADRGFTLGWKPVKGKKAMLDSIKPEVVAIIKEGSL